MKVRWYKRVWVEECGDMRNGWKIIRFTVYIIIIINIVIQVKDVPRTELVNRLWRNP